MGGRVGGGGGGYLFDTPKNSIVASFHLYYLFKQSALFCL